MSDGEAKPIVLESVALVDAGPLGPHPSTIRVSAPFLSHAAIDQHLSHARNNSGSLSIGLDAQERSLAEAREDNVRLQGVIWLDSVRRALQLPIRTFTTACVYYHKFRLAHPSVEYSWIDAAAASLLTSCKNEDTLKKSRDILAAAYNLKQPTTHEHVSADDPMFEASSRIVIGLERLVLESGAFDFRSRSPHHSLVKIAKSLFSRTPGEEGVDSHAVTGLAWTILTDMHRTFAPLKQTSATLALASLELALRLQTSTIDELSPTISTNLLALHDKWHSSRQEVMETLLDALDLYTHHTAATILGSRFSLDDFLRIRLTFNKECSSSSLLRHANVLPAALDNGNGFSNTLRVSNGHPTPVSPPQLGQTSQHNNGIAPIHPMAEGGGTLRFMLNPQRAIDEKVQYNRFHIEKWEEYEEEIEIPIVQPRSRERDADRDRDRDSHARGSESGRRHGRDDYSRDERHRDREREGDRDRGHPRDRHETRYDDRRHEDRDRDRRYDSRRDRDRRYHDDESRRRSRHER
ncbi:cyclin-like protein [Dissoconium aciculare CBS 342.82]|uniref:Cyclin-like protein n=1 Tax=Dissoconium aciculare CBS 342.82 TaxID=1314786 RepID=A0A6J3MHJ4_9PEZI|nr:cyclin-like protein [Dissoconium aciculare CBS 342.82]KAF1827426.1 cyclin-like protein [Dissoconium aciculare CBS 342.82]